MARRGCLFCRSSRFTEKRLGQYDASGTFSCCYLCKIEAKSQSLGSAESERPGGLNSCARCSSGFHCAPLAAVATPPPQSPCSVKCLKQPEYTTRRKPRRALQSAILAPRGCNTDEVYEYSFCKDCSRIFTSSLALSSHDDKRDAEVEIRNRAEPSVALVNAPKDRLFCSSAFEPYRTLGHGTLSHSQGPPDIRDERCEESCPTCLCAWNPSQEPGVYSSRAGANVRADANDTSCNCEASITCNAGTGKPLNMLDICICRPYCPSELSSVSSQGPSQKAGKVQIQCRVLIIPLNLSNQRLTSFKLAHQATALEYLNQLPALLRGVYLPPKTLFVVEFYRATSGDCHAATCEGRLYMPAPFLSLLLDAPVQSLSGEQRYVQSLIRQRKANPSTVVLEIPLGLFESSLPVPLSEAAAEARLLDAARHLSAGYVDEKAIALLRFSRSTTLTGSVSRPLVRCGERNYLSPECFHETTQKLETSMLSQHLYSTCRPCDHLFSKSDPSLTLRHENRHASSPTARQLKRNSYARPPRLPLAVLATHSRSPRENNRFNRFMQEDDKSYSTPKQCCARYRSSVSLLPVVTTRRNLASLSEKGPFLYNRTVSAGSVSPCPPIGVAEIRGTAEHKISVFTSCVSTENKTSLREQGGKKCSLLSSLQQLLLITVLTAGLRFMGIVTFPIRCIISCVVGFVFRCLAYCYSITSLCVITQDSNFVL